MSSLAEKIAAATAPNSLDAIFSEEGIHHIVGVDEVGYGSIAGPVTAAAYCPILPINTFDWEKYIRDSKKMSANSRRLTAQELEKYSVYSICDVSSDDIESMGLRSASHKAMRVAVNCVLKKLIEKGHTPDMVLFDGKHVPRGLEGVPSDCQVRGLPKADNLCKRVGAASILAKVARDAHMVAMHDKWPQYDFHKNKGYGTKHHRRAIVDHGPCPIHRKTFKGVREYVTNNEECT